MHNHTWTSTHTHRYTHTHENILIQPERHRALWADEWNESMQKCNAWHIMRGNYSV